MAHAREDLRFRMVGTRLVAAYCYQDRLFDSDVRGLYALAMLGWRRRFRERPESDCGPISATHCR